jgi:hypothetical protein
MPKALGDGERLDFFKGCLKIKMLLQNHLTSLHYIQK